MSKIHKDYQGRKGLFDLPGENRIEDYTPPHIAIRALIVLAVFVVAFLIAVFFGYEGWYPK